MKKVILSIAVLASMMFVSCESDDPIEVVAEVVAPATYEFTRDGSSTVSYGGQVTRLDMHTQLKSAVSSSNDTAVSLTTLNGMFDHQADATDFAEGVVNTAAELNASSKQLKSKTASSVSYQSDVQDQFVAWFTAVSENANPTTMASEGTIGYLDRAVDGSKRILVDAGGFEYTQVISKSLMGALELDQIVNGYLSDAKLDVENDENKEDSSYTEMEHHWDEAFGYSALDEDALALDAAASSATKRFWGSYIYSVDGTTAGSGIKNEVMTAFLTGRQAIHVKNYDVRDEQATILKQKLSKVCAIKAVNYLLSGKDNATAADPQDQANAFHALSEAYGFIYGLQFSNDGTGAPYFSQTEVTTMLAALSDNGGLYKADIATVIDTLAAQIAAEFGFSAADAQ